MKLSTFLEKHLVDGCIDGTFTTSKPFEVISKIKQIQFDLTLQKDNDEITFIVPNHNKKYGEGIFRKMLLRTGITTETIFLRWIPENEQMFEGFNVKLIQKSDGGGTFTLGLVNIHRFIFWKDQLTSPDSMRENS